MRVTSHDLPMWVIYRAAADRRARYTVRMRTVTNDGRNVPSMVAYDFDSLDDAREHVYRESTRLGLYSIRINRHENDDPVIVETWL